MPLSNSAAADAIVDAFVAQGFSPASEADLKTAMEAVFAGWNPSTPASLASLITDFVAGQQTVVDSIDLMHLVGTVALVSDLTGISASDGDVYVVSGDGHAYVRLSGLWIDLGAFQGPAGVDGKTIRSGSGDPAGGLGADGDFYVKTGSSPELFGPKTAGSWPAGVSLVGPMGDAGWSPLLALVDDGARRVLQVADWEGGAGTKPATGDYVAATGLTATLADAVDVRGAAGAAGASPGQAYGFDTATADADPSAGALRFNNATAASADHIYLSDTEAGGGDVTAWIATFDDSTNPSVKGELLIKQLGSTSFHRFQVTGAVAAGSGYGKVPVAWLAGQGAFAAAAAISVEWTAAGNKGADGAGTGDVLGPASNTDGAIPQWDGADSKTLKDGRAIGVATSTDVPDRAAADTRYEQLSNKAVANGYAGLDSGGKVPAAQLPAAVLGGLDYQGTWDATADSPTIPAAASGNKGWYYKVATAGTTAVDGISDWQIGDWIVSNGGSWDKLDNTDLIISVAGLQGIISGASLRTALNLVVGTDVQAFDDGLAAISALTPAADKLAYFTASNAAALTTLSSFIRTLLDDADAPTAATTLGLLGAQALWFPAASLKPAATNGAATASLETAANHLDFDLLDFNASTIQFAQASLVLGSSWDAGTISAIFVWSHAATTTHFGVSWGLQAVAIGDTAALDAAPGTTQFANDTGGTTDHLYISPATAAVTVAGSPIAGQLVQLQFLRKADDATNDTLAIDARLHGVLVYINLAKGNDA